MSDGLSDIAVLGMAGRWPQAANVAEFWDNMRSGRECIERFPVEKLERATVGSTEADFIRARSILEHPERLDAEFFGIPPREAELMDPQHRVFLECCWEALEDAGCDPERYPGLIGVYAGCTTNTYFLNNICQTREDIDEFVGRYPLGHFPTMLGALSDCLATRVSYKLNLRGPSFTIQSACSTSLVAICQACQSLLSWQCDLALAGGVSISFPQYRGYEYQPGAMGSADGTCRPFDAKACGTVFGSGAGVVALKRLEDALADGDRIHAVIKGFAVNNDGAGKAAYTAPSVEGQMSVIAMAQAMADVDLDAMVYLESHGTATPLGDPLEFRALTQAFRARTESRGSCALGTVKANIGHLEAAAGVSGLINAINVLRHREIPPAVHFETPNPEIDLKPSPFYVNRSLQSFADSQKTPCAGVSSFGVGGTNAHVVIEAAPALEPAGSSAKSQLLVLSAKSEEALKQSAANLVAHFQQHPDIDLAAVAFTLQTGRRAFPHRRSVVCRNVDEAITALGQIAPGRVVTDGAAPQVVFLFPGQGSQSPGMGRSLYQADHGFRADFDTCADVLEPLLGIDLRAIFDPQQDLSGQLDQTWLAQPALFVVEYALAKLLERLGITPDSMIGHSVGEFVAACLSGVFTLEDALAMVATRGMLLQDLPPGAMLCVRMDEASLKPYLSDHVSLAAANAPGLHVLAGSLEAIGDLERRLAQKGVATSRLATSHAFHSPMVEPAIAPFRESIRKFPLNPPRIPYVSTVTGDWVRTEDATDHDFWASHLRKPVLFSQAWQQLQAESGQVFIEVGPGKTLCTLARQHRTRPAQLATFALLPNVPDVDEEDTDVIRALGALWEQGVMPDWNALHPTGIRRCTLPTYPFQRQRFWIDPPAPEKPRSRGTQAAHAAEELSPPPPPPEEMTMPASESPDRITRIRSALMELFEELSGLDLSDCAPDAAFVELGFDSLFLTQITSALQRQFGVRVTFRQLLVSKSTFALLAQHLADTLPPDAFVPESSSQESSSEPTPPPLTSGGPESGLPANFVTPPAAPRSAKENEDVQALFKHQLEVMTTLMQSQLKTLEGLANATQTPAPKPPSTALPRPTEKPPKEARSGGRFTPVRTRADLFDEQQLRHIQELTSRYVARTKASKSMMQKTRSRLADPRAVSEFRVQWKEMVYPLVTVNSDGSKLWDLDGNEYIDLVNGFGPILFGHKRIVSEALIEQIHRGFETGPQTALAGECAELICELTGNERVTFCNTGTEAVIAALRVARTVTGRDKVVMFEGAYHGIVDEVLVKPSPKNAQEAIPVAPGIPEAMATNIVVLEYGSPESLEYIQRHATELAAVLIEVVQSRHPALRPIEFVKQIREITRQSETALIFDEVVTGFRTHPGGIQALFGIRADLVTYGKVLGGGLPIGVLGGAARFMDALDGGMWQYGDDSFPEVGVTFFAGTFVRHPLALAAAKAVLRHLQQAGPELQTKLAERTEALAKRLESLFQEHQVPAQIEQFSSWFFIRTLAHPSHLALLYYHLREKGLHIRDGFPCFLTTAHSDHDLERVYTAFSDSLCEMRQAGFFGMEADPDRSTPADLPAKPSVGREFVAPRNQREELFSQICSRYLLRDRVSIHEDLFDLGVDSLGLFQIFAQAKEAGLYLDPERVMACRTIAEICDALDSNRRSQREMPPLMASGRERYRSRRTNAGPNNPEREEDYVQ